MSSIVSTVHAEGYVTVENGGVRKNISLKDYSKVIQSLLSEADQDLESCTWKLPPSIHSFSKTAQGYVINLYYEEREAEMAHTRAGKGMMYIPNVMIRVGLQEVSGKPGEHRFNGINWYATDKSRNSLPTEWPAGGHSSDHIWTLPFPNMWGDARMCTGGNRLPSVIYMDWTVLDMLYNSVFLGSPFNNDLNVPSLAASRAPDVWFRHLLEHYQDEETARFPYELLRNY